MKWIYTYFPLSLDALTCNCYEIGYKNKKTGVLGGVKTAGCEKINTKEKVQIYNGDPAKWHLCDVDEEIGACFEQISKDDEGDVVSIRTGCHDLENVFETQRACMANFSSLRSRCCSFKPNDWIPYEECPLPFGYDPEPDYVIPEKRSTKMVILIVFVVLFLLAIICYFIYRYIERNRLSTENTQSDYHLGNRRGESTFPAQDQPDTHRGTTEETDVLNGNSTVGPNSVECPDPSEGSGQGAALMVVRSIAREIKLIKKIGRGRFGQVWLGDWMGRSVACKIFDSRDDASWQRETQNYCIKLINHDNILRRVASDTKDNGMSIENWLITDYHKNGSLYDYLSRNAVTLKQSLTLIHSSICGVEHLHKEIKGGAGGKPSIAHRDIKSKNILVSDYGKAVIADLGLAIRYDSATNTINLPPVEHSNPSSDGIKVGTKRYMAPEVLEYSNEKEQNAFCVQDFKSFINSDIYSLGLVLWEIASRTIINDIQPKEYMMPFEDLAPNDPDINQMIDIVCRDKIRPTLEPEIASNPSMAAIQNIIQDCLHEHSSYRIGALRLRKSLHEELKKLDRIPEEEIT